MFLRLNDGEFEYTEKRSRFIATAFAVSSRDEVKARVAELKKNNPEARHVCFGYIADESGLDYGYDDNGEPTGTAGKPIYQAIAASGAKMSCIAVVRYFGGIKLGAGGLTRAYRTAATGVIEKCGLSRAVRTECYRVSCSGDVYKKIQPTLKSLLCKTESIVYNETVEFTVSTSCADLLAALTPFGAKVERIGSRIVSEDC